LLRRVISVKCLGSIGKVVEREQHDQRKPGASMKIGFIGLGRMGAGNRRQSTAGGSSAERLESVAAKGASLCSDAGATLAPNARALSEPIVQIIFTMLADDAALESVLAGDQGILKGLGPERCIFR
jgi:3-hydroxyisobutyrate dehydrogenase-like beta-hydroxyacid dehydrogenase